MNIFFKWKENVQSVREKYSKIEVILKKQEEDQYFVNIIRRADIQKMKTPQQIRNEVEKEEHFYRRGYELRPTGIKLKWYEWIAFWMFLDSILWYKKDFVDFIDNEGNVRRVYPK